MQPAFDAAPPGSEENLNSTTNYPLYIFFYQQRLWIAGTENDPTQLIASRLGMYDDFSDDFSGAETNAFQLRIAGTEKETIQTVLLNQGIQIYTDKGEWILSDTAITRDSGFVRNSTIGSGPVQAVISGGGTSLFVPQNGLGLIALTYSLDFSSYQTPYVSFLTNAIDSPIIDMCLKKGFTSTDDTLIFLTLQNGKVVIANYLTDQQIQSFVVRVSGDSVYQQCIQPGSSVLYLINRNGSIVIEEQNDNRNTEASFDSFSYNPGTGVISSLPDAYNGISINVYDGDGVFAEFIPASGNQATLTTPVPAVSEVGLDINSRMESNPQNIGPETFDKYKTIRSIKVALTENSDGTYMKINGKSPSRTKGKLLTFIRPGRPERESVFTIINDVYKVEIMSIEIELEA